MSLRLLLDEDAQAKRLVALLAADQHDVQTASDANLRHVRDRDVLAFAVQEKRVLLTRNCDDFRALHAEKTEHAGILALYLYNDPDRDMTYAQIVQAISNVEALAASTGWAIAGQFVVLNQFHYPPVEAQEPEVRLPEQEDA